MQLRVFILLVVLGAVAQAQEPRDVRNGNVACENIRKACEAAGFIRNAPAAENAKDLDQFCLNPLLKGQAVQGVTISHHDHEKCHLALAQPPRVPTHR